MMNRGRNKPSRRTVSPEDQKRMDVAKLCRWRKVKIFVQRPMGMRPAKIPGKSAKGWTTLPDYLKDSPMQEALRKYLTQAQRVDYSNHLAEICGSEYEKIFASAEQMADAFLLARKGKDTEP